MSRNNTAIDGQGEGEAINHVHSDDDSDRQGKADPADPHDELDQRRSVDATFVRP